MCQNYNNDPSKDTFTPSLGHDLCRPPPLSRRPCAGSLPAFNLETLPKREVRAVWLTTLSNLDWPKGYATTQEGIERQKRQLTEILDRYAEANINTVLFQARVRATTTHPSAPGAVGPLPHGTGRARPGYDPLRFAIEECHKRGMEIHAWLATIPCGPWTSLGCRRLRAKGTAPQKTGWRGLSRPPPTSAWRPIWPPSAPN